VKNNVVTYTHVEGKGLKVIILNLFFHIHICLLELDQSGRVT